MSEPDNRINEGDRWICELTVYGNYEPVKELVRCKDCKNVVKTHGGLMKCGNYFRTADWYCADGVRRDE